MFYFLFVSLKNDFEVLLEALGRLVKRFHEEWWYRRLSKLNSCPKCRKLTFAKVAPLLSLPGIRRQNKSCYFSYFLFPELKSSSFDRSRNGEDDGDNLPKELF